MNRTHALTLFFLLFPLLLSAASRGKITATLQDAADGSGIPGAVIEVVPLAAPEQKSYSTSGYQGKIDLPSLDYGTYRIKITFLGYEPLEREVKVDAPSVALGVLQMKETSQMIESVVKEVQAIRTSQNGDTVSYNAGAFKVAADADVEGLLQKMPGIKITDGEVEAQGETVKKVFVDGKEFFNDDVTTAIKSLPAEAVDRVEVYNKLSDQAEFTGVDDGEGYKAINIVTRPNMRQGQFGQMYAGYGYDDRYFAGGNVNLFNGSSRLSVIGLLNNINQQNFSFEDILGVSGSSGGRGVGQYMVRPQAGIAKVGSIGLNYSNSWGEKEKLKLTASYFFNRTRTENDRTVDREYYTGDDYRTDGVSDAKNLNHRFNAKLDWKINDRQQLMVRPSFSFQGYNSLSSTLGHYASNEIDDYSRSERDGYNLGMFMIYRLKLGERGSSLTLNANGSYRDSDNDSRSYSIYSDPPADPYKRYLNALTESMNYRLEGNVIFNRPVSKSSQLTFQYRASYRYSDSDKRTYLTNADWIHLSENPDEDLSNIYNSGYMIHRTGPGYRFNKNKNTIVANLYYQYATLAGDQEFPAVSDPKISASFDNLTYFAMAQMYFNAQNSLRLTLNSYTMNPSVTQLQEVVDPSTQFISIGNKNLRPSYSQSLRAHYTHSSVTKGRTFMVMGSASMQNNYIGNNVEQYSTPTPVEINGQTYNVLSYTRPENMNGYWNATGRVSFGTPVGFLRSNLNLDFGVSFSDTPSKINNKRNHAENIGYNVGAVLGSNISENVDFTLSWRGSYNNATNSVQPDSNNKYYTQSASANFKLVLWAGITFQANASYTQYKGITDKYNEDYTLVNVFIGKKLFRNKRGEVIVGVNDMLNQNKSFVRNVTSTYIENVNNMALGRYFSIRFVYNLRLFGKKGSKDINDYEGVERSSGSSRRMGPPSGGFHGRPM